MSSLAVEKEPINPAFRRVGGRYYNFDSLKKLFEIAKNANSHIEKLLWTEKDFDNNYKTNDTKNIPILLSCGCVLLTSRHYISTNKREKKYTFPCEKNCNKLKVNFNLMKDIIEKYDGQISWNLKEYINECNSNSKSPSIIIFKDLCILPCSHSKDWSYISILAFNKETEYKLNDDVSSGAANGCYRELGDDEWYKERLIRTCEYCPKKTDDYPTCMCRRCLKILSNENFSNRSDDKKKVKTKILATCKKCRSEMQRERSYNLPIDKFIASSCSRMRGRSKVHKEDGKTGTYLENDIEYMTNEWKKCEGRCCNCNDELTTITNDPNIASPQRPDASITYTEGNVIWYCTFCNLRQVAASDLIWRKKHTSMMNKLLKSGKAEYVDGLLILKEE